MHFDSVFSKLRRLCRDRRGNFTMMFGLGVAFIFLAAGIAVDYSISLSNKTRINNALDAATLATARAIASGDLDPSVDGAAESYVEAVFLANIGIDALAGSRYALNNVTYNPSNGSVSASASYNQGLQLIQAVTDQTNVQVGGASVAQYGASDIEVAMVLDVTGSMDWDDASGNHKLTALKSAAKSAVAKLLHNSSGAVRISLVPYARAVNVGSDLAKYVYADYDESKSDAPTYSSSLYASTGVGYDYETFQSEYEICGYSFHRVPGIPQYAGWFEPQAPTAGVEHYSDFVIQARRWGGRRGGRDDDDDDDEDDDEDEDEDDLTYSCERPEDFRVNDDGTNVDNCATDRKAPKSGGTNYQYTDANPVAGGMISRDSRLDPDECLSEQIIPLTSTQSTLDTAIEGMSAEGGTAGHIGLQWAWYTISYNWRNYLPATSQPGDLTTNPDLDKYVVFMTDGVFNTAYADNSGSNAWTGHDPGDSESPEHAAALCTAIKAQNIKVFVIAFDMDESSADGNDNLERSWIRDAQTLLSNCATPDTANATYFYLANDAAALTSAFDNIAQTIRQLRLTR
ncbi:pilus assembly protein TadG-related protein [Hoeflea sp.]|uniref:TadE/TadG family type IV pilus assembly protein n=1 Tax=Hoeflea sp. TaxID=1940281 RepID=UPI003B01C8BC